MTLTLCGTKALYKERIPNRIQVTFLLFILTQGRAGVEKQKTKMSEERNFKRGKKETRKKV